ncbi:MAG: MauE/DoxX family redox-associated membrane protein [Fimbriiglobus sp.]
MAVVRVKTNLRCAACVAAIASAFDAEPGVKRWAADVQSAEKPLTVEGEITVTRVAEMLAAHGYASLGEVTLLSLGVVKPAPVSSEPPTTYKPIVLILLYLLAIVAAIEWTAGHFHTMRAMNHFMAGFFLVFSFFKLLDVQAFASSFRMYDLAAMYLPGYAYLYPFLELGLGLAFLSPISPVVTNSVALVVMGVGLIGVVRSLVQKKKVKCACLGAVFNLPMSYVTLTEDLLMVGMSATMLVMLLSGS